MWSDWVSLQILAKFFVQCLFKVTKRVNAFQMNERWNNYEKKLLETISYTHRKDITDRTVYEWFKIAAKYGTPELLKLLNRNISQKDLSLTLSELYARLSNRGTTPFIKACRGGNFRNIDYLISILGEEQLNYNNALSDTISNSLPSNSLIVAEYLIDKGAEVSSSQHWACLEPHYKIRQKILLKDKKEAKAQLELLKFLIKQGVDLDEKDLRGNSITNNAFRSRNFKIIKYLLSSKIIKINGEKEPIREALSPIMFELDLVVDKEQQKSLLKYLKYLVEQGAEIEENSLHLAANFHSLKIIKYLISIGADIHFIEEENNNSVLHTLLSRVEFFASKSFNDIEKIAKYFIGMGVNLEHRNKEGKDAFLMSIKAGKVELAKFIYSLIPNLKSKIYSESDLKGVIDTLLKRFDYEAIKYLDQFPSFSKYFDGENRIRTKNSILHRLVSGLTSGDNFDYESYTEAEISRPFYDIRSHRFKKFKEIFEFFLSNRNNINSIENLNQTPLQQDYMVDCIISWKYLDYMIERGINLCHVSNFGSILHTFIFDVQSDLEQEEYELRKYDFQNYAKYLLIRSKEMNQHIKLPPYRMIDELATFDNIILRTVISDDEGDDGEEQVDNEEEEEEEEEEKEEEEKEEEIEESGDGGEPVRKVARINNKEIHDNDKDTVNKWKKELISCLFKPPKKLKIKQYLYQTKIKFDESHLMVNLLY